MKISVSWFALNVLLLCLILTSCSISQPSFGNTAPDPSRTSPVSVTLTIPASAGESLKNAYTQVGNACDQKQCLFTANKNNEPPLGIATLKGFYQAREIDFTMGLQPTPDIRICDEFVITEGPEEIIRWFTELIKVGNTVNRITAQNQLALSLYLDMLSEQEQARIRASTSDAPIGITVLIPTPPARGPLSKCVTWIEILRVK